MGSTRWRYASRLMPMGDAVLGPQGADGKDAIAVPFMGHPFEQFDLELSSASMYSCS